MNLLHLINRVVIRPVADSDVIPGRIITRQCVISLESSMMTNPLHNRVTASFRPQRYDNIVMYVPAQTYFYEAGLSEIDSNELVFRKT